MSLKTRNFRHAEFWAKQLDSIFLQAVPGMTSKTDLQAILRQYLQDALDHDEQQRLHAPPGKPVYLSSDDNLGDPVDDDLDLLDDQLGDARERLAGRDFRSVYSTVDTLVEQHAIPAELRDALAMGVLQANVRLLERMRDRVLGREVPTFLDAPAQLAPPPEPPPPVTPGKTLSETLPGYIEFQVKEADWRGQTRAQNEKTFAMFKDWCGNRPVSTYERRDTASFYDMLRKLPARHGKGKKWDGMTLKQIIDGCGDEVPRLTMKTISRHFSALGPFFTYLKKRGEYAGDNPAHGFEFKRSRGNKKNGKSKSSRKVWQGEKLTKLFASPVWTGCHPYFRSRKGSEIIRDDKFWLPLLGLFHGNRLEEFAQLRREDIKQEAGIWFFNITDEGDRHLKNEQSIRRVPVHPLILKLSFLRYVEETAPKPSDLVFPELIPGGHDEKLGFSFSKWFSQYRQNIGVYEPRLDYHSFRHSMTTKLFSSGVDRVIVDELTGHEGEGTSQTVYHHGVPLQVLYNAISKVEWPEVDFGHLYDASLAQTLGS